MKNLKQNLLRYHQREQLQNEIKQAEEMLSQAKHSDDRGAIVANINRTKRQLESQSPAPLTPKEKDTLHALEKKLRARITTNMPTEETMRKNPAGAVDWHTRWESANKSLIRMWKNAVIQLNPDSSDRDLANIERYRPSGQVDRMRSDAQISGHMSFGSVPEENWPFETPQTTALAQAQKRYDEEEALTEVDTAIEEVDKIEATDKTLAKRSPEQHAILVERLTRAREALAKKRAEDKAVQEALESEPVEASATI